MIAGAEYLNLRALTTRRPSHPARSINFRIFERPRVPRATVGFPLNNGNAAVQALNAGGTITDSFNYRMSDGSLTDRAVLTITINGANDAAVISGTIIGSVTEASGVNDGTAGTPTASATLTATDPDNPANSFTAVAAGTASTGGHGTFAMTAGGTWTYTVNNNDPAVQALNVGQTLADSFTITSIDGTSKVINITINGANDAAAISGTIIGDANEAGGTNNGTAGTTATGALTSVDIDNNATFTTVASGASTNGYGTFAMTSDGHWTFTVNENNATVQALNVGGTLTDTFTVTSIDGTQQVISVTIHGADDAMVISGATSGAITEQGGVNNGTGAATTTGLLTAIDVDDASPSFNAVASATATTGGYGTYTLTAGGTWTYALDNSNPDVQALNVGAHLTDTFTVSATADGNLRSSSRSRSMRRTTPRPSRAMRPAR